MQKLLGNLYGLISQKTDVNSITEIRVRLSRPILIKTFEKTFFLDFIADKKTINDIIDVATGFSRYAFERELSDGFLEYGNGIRIGVCGQGKINDKNYIAYSAINSICIRIPHCIRITNEIKNLADNFVSTLIIGAPYSGKTTLIRALTSVLAEKEDVAVIDERSEIAGKNTSLLPSKRLDVVNGIPKERVFDGIVRSMSPSIIVCDELFSEKDVNAVKIIVRSGVKCLASFHCDDIKKLPEDLTNIFERFVTLNSKSSPGSITSIIRKND